MSGVPEWFKSLPQYEAIIMAMGHYDENTDYSGPEENAFLSYMIPSTAYGIDLNLTFYQHDALYKMGGTDEDRWLADCAMLTTALRLIQDQKNKWYLTGFNSARKHLARVRMIKYFEIVRSYGHAYFNYTQ